MGFLDDTNLRKIGFKSYGKNVLISENATFYSPEKMSFGNNVRIDDFCILSGSIALGNHIHISAYSALYGSNGIFMEDFTGLSPRCTLFSGSDDFSGNYMIGPMVPAELTNVDKRPITIKKFSQIGAGTIVMPGVTISEGTAIGALSFVKENTKEWSIYAGNPLKYLKNRNSKIKELSKEI